jgi:glycerophosphoryl diester phosphodiesterase/predicted amidohydrolase
MKLCALQIPFGTDEKQADSSAAMAVELLQQCDGSCDVILTPEYTNAPGSFEKGRCIPFAVEHTPALLKAAREAAIRCNAIVAVNYVCEAEPGLFRNTTEIFDRSGKSAGRFFKQHLPRAEKNVNLLDEEYTRSFRAPTVVEVDNIRFGFLICYDTYFTEYVSQLARQKLDVVLVSSFQRAERKDILRMQNVSLAFNCNAYVLRSSVSMGSESPLGGNSMCVAPDGTILGEYGNRCGVFSTEVEDIKYKYMRSNSFGGKLIPNEKFVEQARATWTYRPCGSMTMEGDAKAPYPRICAHRGFNTVAPENSLAAFGSAIALGAAEIELDVRFTKDGIPVVVHDDHLERVSNGMGLIGEKSFGELQALDFGSRFSERFKGLKITTFEEVLCKFARHTIMNLHLKTEEKEGAPEYDRLQMEKLLQLIHDYDQQEHIYFMGDPSVMESALKYAPHIPRCMGAFPGPWQIVERAIEYRCSKVQFFAPYYNEEMIRKAKSCGIRCNFFYCDDPEEAAKLLEMGIDTILTNDYWSVAKLL